MANSSANSSPHNNNNNNNNNSLRSTPLLLSHQPNNFQTPTPYPSRATLSHNAQVYPSTSSFPTPAASLWRLPGLLPLVAGPWLPLNPFVHHMELGAAYDKIKVVILTLTVLPIRAALIFMCLVLAWVFSAVGMTGIDPRKNHEKPIAGWRKDMRALVCLLVRLLFAAGGFHWVTVKGKQASPKEAPILALAPHSTYFDALPVVCLGAPSIVAKGEAQAIPFFGKFITYTEPLYVFRDDAQSRQKTIFEIIKRATSPDIWPQVMIFPEGTCTNRSCLISFKPGAFIPGVPVQPVLIRYPNRLDTVTWTWQGSSFIKIMWFTLTQFHNYCEIEFLPVYVPNEEEKENPKLYASNVRQLMARALEVPLTEYTYEDCRLLLKMDALDFAMDAEKFQRMRLKLGLENSPEEDILVEDWLEGDLIDEALTREELASRLGVSSHNHTFQELFTSLCKEKGGLMDMNMYVILVCWLGTHYRSKAALRRLFRFLDLQNKGEVRLIDLLDALKPITNFKNDDIKRLFRQLDRQANGCVTFDDFQETITLKPEYLKLFVTCQRKILKFLSREPVPSSTSLSSRSLHHSYSLASWSSTSSSKSKDE